jgi:hypothetical protein
MNNTKGCVKELILMSEWIRVGGPCRRQCDVDSKTLVCHACGMWFRRKSPHN